MLFRYISCTIEDHIKDHAEVYDAVVASEVVEHVVNPELFIKSCVTALKVSTYSFLFFLSFFYKKKFNPLKFKRIEACKEKDRLKTTQIFVKNSLNGGICIS